MTIGTDNTTRYYYTGSATADLRHQVLEECDGSGARLRYHIPGCQYVDEQVATYTEATGRWDYYLLGRQFNVIGHGNVDGSVIQPLDFGSTGDFAGCGATQAPADFDHDGDIDRSGFVAFQGCITGEDAGLPDLGFEDKDLDHDTDVDQEDFGEFQGCFSGTYGPIDPLCLGSDLPASGTSAMHGLMVDVLPDGKTLLYARARHYDQEHARWLQRDPLGFVDGPNLYEAFKGNALAHVDPSGQVIDPFSATGLVIAAAIYFFWPPDMAVAPQGTPGEDKYVAVLKKETERERYIFVATVFLFPVGSAWGGELGVSVGGCIGRTTGSKLAGTTAAVGTRYFTTAGVVTAGQELALSTSVAVTEGLRTVPQLYDDPGDLKRIGVEGLFNLGLTGAVDLIGASVARPRAAVVEIEGQRYVAVSGGSRMTVSEASRLTGMSEAEVASASAERGGLTVVRPAEDNVDIRLDAAEILGKPIRPADSPTYSVVLEADLKPGMFTASDAAHFRAANRQLHQFLQDSPELAAQLEQYYPGITAHVSPGPRGGVADTPPPGLIWHHHPKTPGKLQLIPRDQHSAPGPVQHTLHPNQRGGRENWGGGR